MIETDDGQPGVAPASFTRGAILASVLVVAIPAIISVSTLAMDHTGSEPHREIVTLTSIRGRPLEKSVLQALMWLRRALVL
jgi:hypothetical protein